MLKRLIINKHYKFQYEKLKKSHVLLYPEGVITLNNTAADILKLCDGTNTSEDIKNKLLSKYNSIEGLDEFIDDALKNNWIKVNSVLSKV